MYGAVIDLKILLGILVRFVILNLGVPPMQTLTVEQLRPTTIAWLGASLFGGPIPRCKNRIANKQ
jgi:hypothetical protein